MRNQFTAEEDMTRTNYSRDGVEIVDSTDPFAQVTSDVETGSKRYYVSYSTYGVESNRMRNPHSQFQPDQRNREVPSTGRKMFELREVSAESFELYTEFLKTSNEAALRNAERVAR